MGGIQPEGGGGFRAAAAGIGVGSRLARYRLEEQIGQGGMAVVFRAHDEQLGRQVALKVMAPALAADDAFRQRFVRESRAAATVDDPHIIPVFEAGETDGVLFIAMRYVGGGDVGTLVRRHGPLSASRAAAIASPIASALDAAHHRGLVHRDVKPANMLLDVQPGRPDHVYLSDFGLSKRTLSSANLTGSGQFLGTLYYSAPEQIQGQRVDGRADQYALACAAFELLSGAPPFPREQITAVMWAHMSEAPPALTSRRPELPSAVDGVLARALAKAPADRYATCRDFVESLRAALRLPPYDVEPGTSQQEHPATVVAWSATVTRARAALPTPNQSGLLPSRLVNTLAGGSATLVFGPDGDLLTSSLEEATVRRWNPVTGDQMGTSPLQDGDSQIYCDAFSPDGRLLASGEDNETVKIWDTATGRHLRTIKGRTGSVVAVALSPDGHLLASCTPDSPTIRLWDMTSGNPVRALRSHMGEAPILTFSPDGRTLAGGGAGHTARLWDIATGRCLDTLNSDKIRLRDRLLALSGRFSDEPSDLDGCDVSAIAFSPDRQMLACGDEDGLVRLWTLATGRLWHTLEDSDDERPRANVRPRNYSGDRDYVAYPDRRETRGSAGNLRYMMNRARNHGYMSGTVSALAFSRGGRQMAVAIGDSLQMWDLTIREHVRTLQGHASPVLALAFSPDGRLLASSDADTVRLWA
jgi:serine/threonine protein kinase